MLYERLVNQGTLNEPSGKPNPLFALPATVGWMKALRILCEHNNVTITGCKAFYQNAGRRTFSIHAENSVFEHLLMSLHHLSALREMQATNCVGDISRVAVLAWYYGVYSSANAMIVAQGGQPHETHANTAKVWDDTLASKGLIMPPFNWRVSTLVKSAYKMEIAGFRATNAQNALIAPIESVDDAKNAAAAYLSGSAEWYAWRAKDDLIKRKDLKDQGHKNFRSKAARELRDKALKNKPVCFLHQAYRYRGKANYREALFLAYGSSVAEKLATLPNDLYRVLSAFLTMAGIFSSKRLGKQLWAEFVVDLEQKRAFSLSPREVWG